MKNCLNRTGVFNWGVHQKNSKRYKSSHKLLKSLCFSLIVSLVPFSVSASHAGETTVQAVYKINAPVGSGKFHFASAQSGNRYKMQGSAKFKAFLGFYKWKSSVASNGYIYGYKPRPNIYAFSARSDEKAEAIRMNFSRNGVKKIKAVPPNHPHPKRIAVNKSHLRNVVDPLSAMLAFTDKAPSLTNGTRACNRSIKIFDGRQRFNVSLSFKRKAYAELSNGQSRTAFVCRAKYKPVAGHKRKNKAVSYMANSKGLEIWLVPLPKAKMYVPYKIVIPIMIGTASAELDSFKVSGSKTGNIALAR